MLSATCTKNGTGMTLWGDYDDLHLLYQLVHKLTGDGEWTHDAKGGRVQILHSFAYEVRHAYQGSRLKNQIEFSTDISSTYLGFNRSWIDVVFTIAALRYQVSYSTSDELEQAVLYQLEYWAKSALYDYDAEGAKMIESYIGLGAVDVSHDWIWQFNQQLEIDYMEMKANKTRFRKIPYLLNQLNKWAPTHSMLTGKIEATARELNCDVFGIEYLEYPDIKW